MRYLACFIVEEDGELVKKTQMLYSKEENVHKGAFDILKRLSTEYNLPAHYIDRDDENPKKGVLYINPKREYCPTSLCGLDEEDWERREYAGLGIG
jgi:hypothetical protein